MKAKSNARWHVSQRVRILPTNETGKITTIFVNGAIVERDGGAERRFITVRFVNLEPLDA